MYDCMYEEMQIFIEVCIKAYLHETMYECEYKLSNYCYLKTFLPNISSKHEGMYVCTFMCVQMYAYAHVYFLLCKSVCGGGSRNILILVWHFLLVYTFFY